MTSKISKITTNQYDSPCYLQFNVTRKIEKRWSPDRQKGYLAMYCTFPPPPSGHDAS